MLQDNVLYDEDQVYSSICLFIFDWSKYKFLLNTNVIKTLVKELKKILYT